MPNPLPYGLKSIKISPAPPKDIRICMNWRGRTFYGMIYDDQGRPFATTRAYTRRSTLRRGMDRFFGKLNWKEVK